MYHKRRVERKERQFIPIDMPPSMACSICRNKMNDICLSICAPAEDYKSFDPDMDIDPDLLPNLTIEEYRELSGKMKGEWLFVQQRKLLEAVNGQERYFNRTRGRRIPKAFQKQDLQDGATEQDPLHQNREECKDKEEGPSELDRCELRKVSTS